MDVTRLPLQKACSCVLIFFPPSYSVCELLFLKSSSVPSTFLLYMSCVWTDFKMLHLKLAVCFMHDAHVQFSRLGILVSSSAYIYGLLLVYMYMYVHGFVWVAFLFFLRNAHVFPCTYQRLHHCSAMYHQSMICCTSHLYMYIHVHVHVHVHIQQVYMYIGANQIS